MTRRPTIADLAKASGVSVATVDRVLNRRLPVREDTALRVVAAAEAIGYHATGLLKQRLSEIPARSFGFLLQKRDDDFYKSFAVELVAATKQADFIRGRAMVEFMDEIVPSMIAVRIAELGAKVDALAVVAVDHPLVNEAIAAITGLGKPLFTLLSDVTAPSRTGYLSVDSRKAGRTAAWAISRLAKGAGKIGILLGSHRYLSQELSEISFRSYMREHAPEFQLLEPLVNLDDQRLAYEAISHLVASNPDLVGIYVAGGGAEGMVRALRDEKAGDRIVAVCNELMPVTRAALIDGTVDLVLATPIVALAARAVEAMARACNGESLGSLSHIQLAADIYVSENI
ncbi:MAG: LacI family DNA-binding transcriptional regulator [Rhizobiales bacterium]|nr:LacI family DNA-binding transcriptional regulator [Hyphomicrobiales bacterium]